MIKTNFFALASTIVTYFTVWNRLKIPCAAAFSIPGHLPSHSHRHRHRHGHRLATTTSYRGGCNYKGLALSFTNSNQESSRASVRPDIFVLSYDGVVADTNEWRSNLAISVAFETWPQLCNDSSFVTKSSTIIDDNDNYDNNGLEWLRNKLCALIQVTLSGEDGLLGCDSVLLARLILEEQELDGGRSNGCTGKYGSLFHPSSSQSRSANVGSRPLTVGEIAANWNDGACLKDTVRIKYNVNGKDPMPVIRQNIFKFLQNEQQNEHKNSRMLLPQIHSFVSDALLDCESPVLILIGHESHALTVKSSLEQLNLPIHILLGDEMMKNGDDRNHIHLFQKRRGIFLIPPGQGGRGHEGVLEDILSSAPEESLVHVIHSDIDTLQRAKSLFGDDRPRRGMFGKCVKSNNQNVGLKLSLLSTCSGQQQQNEAEMDPWLNLLHEFEFVETLTSKVQSSSSSSTTWE